MVAKVNKMIIYGNVNAFAEMRNWLGRVVYEMVTVHSVVAKRMSKTESEKVRTVETITIQGFIEYGMP